MKRINIVCLSGGLDSTTLLTEMIQNESEVYAVAFKYMSKHNALELKSAEVIAEYLKVPLTVIDLTSVFAGFRSSLIEASTPVPEGHYTDDSMKSTVVPLRNLIFTTVAAAAAIDFFSSLYPDIPIILSLGVHAGDHPIYPDCRPATMSALNDALRFGSVDAVSLSTPYIDLTKTEIVSRGLAIDAPYRLTRTCYTQDDLACGKCGSCRERFEAFSDNDTVDPIPYRKHLTNTTK